MEYKIVRDNDYLEHHGVKGQKRGQRRYQNPDGSLTAEGKEHYGVGNGRQHGGTQQNNKASGGDHRLRKFYQRHERGFKITSAILGGVGAATAASLLTQRAGLDDGRAAVAAIFGGLAGSSLGLGSQLIGQRKNRAALNKQS